jgi:hypothetical protein
MGLDTRASLVVGVSMAKLFSKIEEKTGLFDEFDKYGNKTGKQFKEEKLMATLPNGNEYCIAENKTSTYKSNWDYDFYDSMGFDGGSYVGDAMDITMTIHYPNHDVNDLSQMIMGLMVCETGWMDGLGAVKVDEIVTNEAINRVRKELAELFGYTGDVELYLLNDLSY